MEITEKASGKSTRSRKGMLSQLTEETVHKWAIEDLFKGDEWSCQKDY